jgi:hypothetical protein
MSDGMSEVFAPRNAKKNTPKTVEINKYVHIKIFKDRVLIINEKAEDQICLKKDTLKKIVGKI